MNSHHLETQLYLHRHYQTSCPSSAVGSEDGLVAEADNNGAVTTSYHYQLNTPWGTDPLFIRQGGVYGYYITDHLGTPQRVVGSNGAVLWGAVYDAFGGAEIGVASVVSNLRFPGQYFDAESGLHYNYWRYYDSGTGGYVSSDRLGLFDGPNTYIYVQANPTKLVDPLGLSSCFSDCLMDQLGISELIEYGSVVAGSAAFGAWVPKSGGASGGGKSKDRTSRFSKKFGRSWGQFPKGTRSFNTSWRARAFGRLAAKFLVPGFGAAFLIWDVIQITKCTMECEDDEDCEG